MEGTVGILNVFGGDTKLVFDNNNVAETIRAKRIVKDMLKRGYMLCVKDTDGKYVRATDFDESTGEYIIADLDPTAGDDDGQRREEEAQGTTEAGTAAAPAKKKRGRPRGRVKASESSAVAVPRTAGG